MAPCDLVKLTHKISHFTLLQSYVVDTVILLSLLSNKKKKNDYREVK